MTELLHAVRGWRTVRDAAARLSETSGRIVDEAEVLRLGLEGHLPLSVNFVEDVAGTLGSFVPFPEAEQSAVIARNNGVYPRTIKLDGSPYFFQPTEPEEVIAVTGIWDLPFPFLDPDGNWADSAPLELEHRWKLLVGPPGFRMEGDCLFVNRPDGTWCQLRDSLPDDVDIVVRKATPRTGKTRLLEVQELLVARPWLTGRTSAAALVRKVDAESPTLLLDESDAAFGGDRDYAEALRGILNTGYLRSGRTTLCVGQGHGEHLKSGHT